nr:NADH dehydrogenase [ubiquinone] flavoprotein 3, mitochondrial isoform X5 [Equus asinus]
MPGDTQPNDHFDVPAATLPVRRRVRIDQPACDWPRHQGAWSRSGRGAGAAWVRAQAQGSARPCPACDWCIWPRGRGRGRAVVVTRCRFPAPPLSLPVIGALVPGGRTSGGGARAVVTSVRARPPPRPARRPARPRVTVMAASLLLRQGRSRVLKVKGAGPAAGSPCRAGARGAALTATSGRSDYIPRGTSVSRTCFYRFSLCRIRKE